MTNKRVIFGAFFICAAAAIFYLTFTGGSLETIVTPQIATPAATESVSEVVAQQGKKPQTMAKALPAEVVERIAAMADRRPDTEFAPEAVEEALAQDRAWYANDDPSLAERFELDDVDLYDGREFVDFNPIKIETLQPGDVMEIPIPQEAEQFEMTVSEVVDNHDGTVTWRGTVNGYDSQNQVTITKDNYNTYFSMFTPDLNYVVHAKGDAAYVVSSGTLFKVPEGAETDVVYPPGYEGPRD